MRRRTSLILASASAVCLLTAGFAFPFVIATGPAEVTWLDVGAVFMSHVLIAPVLIQLLLRWYAVMPGAAIVCAALFAFAVGLETVAVLVLAATLAPGLAMLRPVFLALDLPGATLFYVSGGLLAVTVGRRHRPAAALLGLSLVLFVVGLPIGLIAPEIGASVTALSIAAYAAAYPLLADVANRLDPGVRLQADLLTEVVPAALPFVGAARVTRLHR